VYALLEGWSVEHAIRFANAAGSFVAARFACADAMPTIEDLADHVPAVRA
jgi:5-dehydro-2-deoxygluconokinase